MKLGVKGGEALLAALIFAKHSRQNLDRRLLLPPMPWGLWCRYQFLYFEKDLSTLSSVEESVGDF